MARAERLALSVIVVAALSLFAAAPAEACSCVGGTPLCETFWRMDSVFSGEVLSITEIESSDVLGPRRRVRFRVERTFRGAASRETDIFTGAGGGDCGFNFTKGEKYLVFANVWNGRMTTSICSPTRRLADAAEALAYVSQPFPPAAGGRIYGSVQARTGPDDPLEAAANFKVILRDGKRTWTTTSDASGAYEFKGIPAGKYAIELALPENLVGGSNQEVELFDARGCAREDFYVTPNGRITTSLDASGALPKDLLIELIDASTLGERFPTLYYRDEEVIPKSGELTWTGLPPGRYVLGVNITRPPDPKRPYAPTFYPGVRDAASARVIQVGLGERVEIAPFTMPPPQPLITIRGSVVRSDSRPAAGVSVTLDSAEPHARDRQVTSVQADKDGRFAIVAVAGSRYRVRAAGGTLSAASEPFELSAATAPILLVVRPAK